MKATVRIQRVHRGKSRRKETESQAAMRALADLALLQVMRDGLLRRAEAAALRWGDVEVHAAGSGRLHVVPSKTDQTAEGAVLDLGPAAVEALLVIRSQEAVIDPGANIFGLSAGQISRRIKAATKIAGKGDDFSAHSPRVRMAQDLSAAGAELPELMTAEGWESPTMPAKYTEAQAAGRGPSPVFTGATSRDEPDAHIWDITDVIRPPTAPRGPFSGMHLRRLRGAQEMTASADCAEPATSRCSSVKATCQQGGPEPSS